jgi:DNA-binding NtrC family response regulator
LFGPRESSLHKFFVETVNDLSSPDPRERIPGEFVAVNMFKQTKENPSPYFTPPSFAECSTVAQDPRVEHDRNEQIFDGRKPHILVINGDIATCDQLKDFYISSGYTVEVVSSGEEALKRLETRVTDLVVTDIALPFITGLEFIGQLQRDYPDVSVIAISPQPGFDQRVEVQQYGACDYIIKPFTLEMIQQSTRAALEKARVFCEIRTLRRSLNAGCEFAALLSRTPEMHRVFETIQMISPTNMTVLVEGESGTGKELIASAIHYQSFRRDGPFITVNCAEFPDSLLESEIFGCEQGGLTGTELRRTGKIKLAHGGTLFLDDIESMALHVQSKLLRVLEDYNTVRLGGNRTIDFDIDTRVIAGTHVPAEDLVAQGKMRTDFYYRINVVPIHLIPLRERLEDIPILVADFLREDRIAAQKGINSMSQQAMNRLVQYHWPGNLSELQNVLEKAIVLTKGSVIEVVDLPAV